MTVISLSLPTIHARKVMEAYWKSHIFPFKSHPLQLVLRRETNGIDPRGYALSLLEFIICTSFAFMNWSSMILATDFTSPQKPPHHARAFSSRASRFSVQLYVPVKLQCLQLSFTVCCYSLMYESYMSHLDLKLLILHLSVSFYDTMCCYFSLR
jgi:hypothetical protein